MRSIGARFVVTLALVQGLIPIAFGGSAHAQEPFIGEIRWVGFQFAPRGWAMCDGQLLQISQNTALFSLLGTTYGGDGRTTFALPDLRGRVPLHWGEGTGLTPRALGEEGGAEMVTLSTEELPAHNHTLNASSQEASATSPVGNALAEVSPGDDGGEVNSCVNETNGNVRIVSGAEHCRRHEEPTTLIGGSSSGTKIYASQAPDTPMHPQSIGESGGGVSHPNMQPYLGLNCIIALVGIFPSR